MERMTQATTLEEDPLHGILRKVFWIALYAQLVLPIVSSALFFFNLPFWLANVMQVTIRTGISLNVFLVVLLAVFGANGGAFVDTPGQRRLFLGAMAMGALLLLLAIVRTHLDVRAAPEIFNFEAPQHVWDFRTIFVYNYQFLYMSLLVGAMATVLRNPKWAARLMMAAVLLCFFEANYRWFVVYNAFLPTHIVLIHEQFDKFLLDYERYDTIVAIDADFTMGRTSLVLVAFAIALALAAMARNKGATEEGTNEV